MKEIISFKVENLSDEAKAKLDKMKIKKSERLVNMVEKYENGDYDEHFQKLN